MKTMSTLLGFFISLSVAHADVLNTSLTLAHDIDSAASLNMTVSKDLGDKIVAGENVVFRLETNNGTPLIQGGSHYAGSAFFYNSYNGLPNVYVLDLNLYDKKTLDTNSANRVNFFVNLKNSKLVFYKYANGAIGDVTGILDMASVCTGPVQNLSGADKCNISSAQVRSSNSLEKTCSKDDHQQWCSYAENSEFMKSLGKELGCKFVCN